MVAYIYSIQVRDYKVGDLCPCACKCVNASIGNVEHWMCGESWLALQPTIPSSQGWASSVLFNFHLLLFIWTYNLCLSMRACSFLSRRGCLCVYVGVRVFLSRRGCLYHRVR